MNEVIKVITEHRSIRDYLDKEVDDKLLAQIINSVQHAPNWVNMQHVSVIVIKDKEHLKTMAKLCGNQAHIAKAPVFLVFCADYYRTDLAMQKYGQSVSDIMGGLDNLLVASHEVGIALGSAVIVAESLGLGTVPIGDVRLHPIELIKMLKLPKLVIPILGLCVGYASNNPGIKPRLTRDAVCFDEVYNQDLDNFINDFDKTYANYLKNRSHNSRLANWSQSVADFYHAPYNHYPQIEQALKQQGFIK